MPSTYTTNLGIELPADGELDGVWGDVVNENMDILDRAINGSVALTLSGTTSTLTTSDGALSDGQYKLLVLGGTPSGTHTITIAPSDAQKIYFVRNTTAQSVVFTQGSGGNVTIATGDSAIIYSDGAGAGAAVVNITNDFAMSSVKITGGSIDGTVIGGTSAAAGTFTTATATTGNITTVNATTVDTTNLEVTTLKAKDGTAAGSIADSTGVVTLASSVLTTTDINGGTIDGAVIGGSSAAAGTFTTATATTGNITTVNATTVDTTNIEVTTLKAKDGTSAGSIADSTGVVTLASSVLTTTDINGGTIDGTTIGGASAAAGTFTTATATTGNITTVNATTVDTTNIEVTTIKAKDGTSAGSIADSTGVVTLASSVLTTADINGGTIDGAVIGGSSAAAITGTTITATGDLTIADKIVHAGDTNTAIRFPAADTVTVETSGVERLRVDSSGNVGIGTSSFNQRLQVNLGSSGALFQNGSDPAAAVAHPYIIAPVTTGHSASPAYGFWYQTTGISNPASEALGFVSNGSERMRITSAGNVGIGTTSISYPLDVASASNATIRLTRTASHNVTLNAISGGAFTIGLDGSGGTTERLRIDASGNVGIGADTAASARVHINSTSPSGFEDTGNTLRLTCNASSTAAAGATGAGLVFAQQWLSTGGGLVRTGGIYGVKTAGDGGFGGGLAFYTQPNSSGAMSERARIDSSGNLLVGRTNSAFGNVGAALYPSGLALLETSASATIIVNRISNDGNLVEFCQGGNLEGTISVSGTTVSYNGGHLSRWAQFPDNSRPDLFKGTVMSNLDQMSNWDDEDNEQLNCVQVSTVEGDANVAGVFVAWDSNDDGYNDILLGMTGDMVIRIAGGTTVQRGDLLMSAGDGTAKPQGDDIVRSKTIAKVTSTHVSHTYADGSYAVPCVLMAC